MRKDNPRGDYLRTTVERVGGVYRFSWGDVPYGPEFRTYAEAEKRLNEIHQASGLDARHSDERKL